METRRSGPPTDLVETARQDEKIALQLWQDHFQDLAMVLAADYGFSREEAEDAAEIAREKFCRNLHKLGENLAVVTWTERLIANTCKDLLKKERRRVPLEEITDEEIPEEFSVDKKTPVELLEEKEARVKQAEFFEIVKDLTKQLRPVQRDVVNMHLLEGRSLVEISEKLGIKYRTAAARSSKGIEALAMKIARKLEDPAFRELIYAAFGEEGIKIIQKRLAP